MYDQKKIFCKFYIKSKMLLHITMHIFVFSGFFSIANLDILADVM